MSECLFDGCGQEAKVKGLCWGHYKQFQRRREFRPLVRPPSPRERLEIQAIALGNADTDDDREFRLLRRRFWKAYRIAVATDVRVGLAVQIRRTSGSASKGRRRDSNRRDNADPT